MALGTIANYTSTILWKEPDDPAGIITMVVNGSSEVRAGYPVTSTGHTYPDCGRPDADADLIIGVALERPDVAIGSYFSDNDEISVALIGSGAGVWVYIDDDEGALEQGTKIYSTGVDDDGLCEVAGDGGYVGITVQDEADQGADDVPTKVLLYGRA